MELEPLLHPIAAGPERCGSDLIFSPEFDEIREARRFDDSSLAQGEWITPLKEAQWDKVILICQDVLTNKSKDLRIAAWLTEANAKTDGLAGLAHSYRLLTRLCEAYWEDIHPQPDNGDHEERIGALDWLLSQSAQWIREIPLTRSPRGAFSLIDQEAAQNNSRNIERNPEQAGENSSPTIEIFEAAVMETPAGLFSANLQAALDLQQAMTASRTILDGHLGEHAPSFGPAFDALDNVIHFLRRHTTETNIAPGVAKAIKTTEATRAQPSAQPQQADPPLPTVAQEATLTRELAIRQLREIAAFFRRTEPHSPVAYLADKAARWGSMSLHEWLSTVVRDDAALLHVEELLGVERRLPENDGS